MYTSPGILHNTVEPRVPVPKSENLVSGLSPSASEKCLFLNQVSLENSNRQNRQNSMFYPIRTSRGYHKILRLLYLHCNVANDMEKPGTKRFISKGFELGTTFGLCLFSRITWFKDRHFSDADGD